MSVTNLMLIFPKECSVKDVPDRYRTVLYLYLDRYRQPGLHYNILLV